MVISHVDLTGLIFLGFVAKSKQSDNPRAKFEALALSVYELDCASGPRLRIATAALIGTTMLVLYLLITVSTDF